MQKQEKRRDKREYGIRWIAGEGGKAHVDEVVVGADRWHDPALFDVLNPMDVTIS